MKPGTTVSGILIPKRKDGVPPMTERQKKFAEYYAQCGNAAQSAIQAGYSKKYANTNASKLLQNTTITEYIKQLTEDAQTARIMTACERQALLSDIAKDKQNELSDRIRAIDTLNKMTGEYTQKISIDGDLGVKIVDDC
jgi:phage terminase small subunit|nr:MAG TPA: Terminase small subunit [Caudoviricetes sp.]